MSNKLFLRNFFKAPAKTASLILILNFVACSIFKSDEVDTIALGSNYTGNISARWFNEQGHFAHHDFQGRTLPHLFFDPLPEIDSLNRRINFVPITPASSQFIYDLDLRSGQRFQSELWCEQEDFTKEYNKTLDRIPFTIGIVPRILDQLSKAQKIIVFGNDKEYQSDIFKNIHNVKVVGGMLEQSCPYAKCTKSASWLSRMIIIAVDDRDSNFKNVENLTDLREKVDWKEALAYLRNYNGHNLWSGAVFGKTRMTGELSPRETIKILLDKSYRFNPDRFTSLKKSCGKVYQQAINKLKNWKADDGYFVDIFTQFYKKYGKNYKTCLEYVRPGNISHDPERLWFLAHLDLFMLLNQMGYYYDCGKAHWYITPTLQLAKKEKVFRDNLKNCSTESLDKSFDAGKKIMVQLANQRRPYFEYIEYDSGAKGTKDKIYNWVYRENRNFVCLDKGIRPSFVREVFPKDVRWLHKSSKAKDGFIR